MALETIEDIIRALQEHPEWRKPLPKALLPERYQQLSERAGRLEEVLARLAEEDEAIGQSCAALQKRQKHASSRWKKPSALSTPDYNNSLSVSSGSLSGMKTLPDVTSSW